MPFAYSHGSWHVENVSTFMGNQIWFLALLKRNSKPKRLFPRRLSLGLFFFLSVSAGWYSSRTGHVSKT